MATLADILRQTGYAQGGALSTPAPVESPMTKAISDHIASIPQKFNENQAHQMDLLARAYPGNTFKSNMLEGDPKALAELAMQIPTAGMMIGPSSALWNKENAFNAAKMLKNNILPEQVWKTTGTAKGLENAYRQEISDELALLKGTGNFGQIYEHRKAMHGVTTPTVEEVMRHPQLFEAYPQLKGIQVQLLPATSRNNATYSPVERIISVNPNATSEQAKSSMLHELQHAIQESEGWNKGANAGTFLKKYQEQADELEERLIQANKDLKLHAGGKYYDDLLKERDEIAKEYRDFMGADYQGVIQKATKEYKAHGGEAEARLTQARQKLTKEQRKQIYPFAKGENALDINPEDAIIKMENNSPTITRKELLKQLLDKEN
jgi:Zn-dependent peptidase ImmA (M78 family)